MILRNTVTTKISDFTFDRIKFCRVWNKISLAPSQLDLRHSKSYPVLVQELPKENTVLASKSLHHWFRTIQNHQRKGYMFKSKDCSTIQLILSNVLMLLKAGTLAENQVDFGMQMIRPSDPCLKL